MKKRIKPPTSLALALLRMVAGLSQKELAELAGLKPDTISDWELGRTTLDLETLRWLADVMRLDAGLVDKALALVEEARSPQRAAGHPLAPGPEALRRIEEIAASAGGGTVDLLRSELLRRFRIELAKEARRRARELWERLRPLSPEGREALVLASPAFRSWALVELLCAESTRSAANSAAKAVALARLALAIADHCPGEELWIFCLRAYALAHLANALRVQGELAKAREAFARARGLWRAGAGAAEGVLDGTRLLDLEASLQIEEGDFDRALGLLDEALERAGPLRKASLLIKKARALEFSGDEEGALRILQQAVPLVDRQGDPRQYLVLRFNLLTTLCRLGRYGEAEAGLGEVWRLTEGLDNGLDLLRAVWLRGTVAAGLGRLAEATAALEEVREALTRLEIGFDSGLASLELAAVYLEGDHTVKARHLARAALVIFQRQKLQPHALAAVTLFTAAAEREEATADLARRLVAYLRRAQYDSRLQFEAGA